MIAPPTCCPISREQLHPLSQEVNRAGHADGQSGLLAAATQQPGARELDAAETGWELVGGAGPRPDSTACLFVRVCVYVCVWMYVLVRVGVDL